MSGILRSFDRLISQSQLAKSGHKFLLRSNNATLHPTAYYYQKHSSQRLANELDVFQLGVATAALTRQAKNYSQLLEHTEQESVRAEIQERLTTNLNEINAYFGEILSLFKIGRKECPIQTVADISFVLADGPLQVPNANTLIADNLLPTLNEKLQYASVHNLQDILTAFVKLNYVADKELLKRLLTALSKKDFPNQLENVTTHAWSVDQYETTESANTCNLMACTENTFEKYISQGGAESTAARIRFTAAELWDYVSFNFINPFVFREKRINHRFAKRSVEYDHDVLLATLSKLQEIVPEASETIATIKAKL